MIITTFLNRPQNIPPHRRGTLLDIAAAVFQQLAGKCQRYFWVSVLHHGWVWITISTYCADSLKLNYTSVASKQLGFDSTGTSGHKEQCYETYQRQLVKQQVASWEGMRKTFQTMFYPIAAHVAGHSCRATLPTWTSLQFTWMGMGQGCTGTLMGALD